MNNYVQASIFDTIIDEHQISTNPDCRICLPIGESFDCVKFSTYNIEKYKVDIETIGLEKTWEGIISFALNGNPNHFLNIDNFAELYELGLAFQDKYAKKESGQYYTPDDVAIVMAKWFDELQGENICDVACGTGKLILTYLSIIGYEKARHLLAKGSVYLYDNDKTALTICKTILVCKYGKDIESSIHAICGDFLSKNLTLPQNCKVLSNPPYASVCNLPQSWSNSSVASDTKELYAIFMEKIIRQSRCSVIITPYSFLGGNKFLSLREELNHHTGFVTSFDNVPGNIFCGRKHGIFNTNTANSVRAAITVVEDSNVSKGFRMTPLIRFKNEERANLLQNNVLESFIDDSYQLISDANPMYNRCFKSLRSVWDKWISISKKALKYYVDDNGKYTLSMPNTCRYFTTAANGRMNRNGQIILSFSDKHVYNYMFCLINSSFAYWYWRNYDGGITYPKGLLLNLPVFFDKLKDEDKQFFDNMAEDMMKSASQYTVTKNNVGVQENIKYPRSYRDKINRKLLDILGCNISEKEFDIVHSNMALEVNI